MWSCGTLGEEGKEVGKYIGVEGKGEQGTNIRRKLRGMCYETKDLYCWEIKSCK